MSQVNRNRKRGKENERAIAKLMGGKRVGILGNEDVEHEVFSIECKSLMRFAGVKIMEQCERNAPEGNLPISIVHIKNKSHKEDIVMLRFSDFQDWFGGGGG